MNQSENSLIKSDDEKRINDFKLISDELKRQFDILLRFDDSHDTKSGIIIGFIMLVIIQISLTMDYTNKVIAKPIASAFFLVGFATIFYSFLVGVYGFNLRTYEVGPKIKNLNRQWRAKKEKDYTKNIFGTIWKTYESNKQIIERKAKFVKCMLWLFSGGLIFIVLSKIALMVT
jgi:hypothetical protein